MTTTETPTCRWCHGGHEIEHCPAVLAAFVRGYGANETRLPAAARPCARPGCGEPRWHGTPYCHPHRLEVVRAADAKRKAARRDYERERYAARTVAA